MALIAVLMYVYVSTFPQLNDSPQHSSLPDVDDVGTNEVNTVWMCPQ